MPSNSDPFYRAKALLEGMWQGDLNDLVSSKVSIDEYESKVDDKAMVIGFYVHDMDAASDLNRFIQKSTVDILYSEVSPAPNQQGFYMVFVELLDNAKLVDNICELIEEVTFLTNVEEWTANIFGSDKPIKISKDTMTAALEQARKADVTHNEENRNTREIELRKRVDLMRQKLKAAQKRLLESSLDSVNIQGGNLLLTTRGRTFEYELEHIGNLDALDNRALSMDFNSLRECRELAVNLGEGWDVAKSEQSFLLHLMEGNVVIVVRPIV